MTDRDIALTLYSAWIASCTAEQKLAQECQAVELWADAGEALQECQGHLENLMLLLAEHNEECHEYQVLMLAQGSAAA